MSFFIQITIQILLDFSSAQSDLFLLYSSCSCFSAILSQYSPYTYKSNRTSPLIFSSLLVLALILCISVYGRLFVHYTASNRLKQEMTRRTSHLVDLKNNAQSTSLYKLKYSDCCFDNRDHLIVPLLAQNELIAVQLGLPGYRNSCPSTHAAPQTSK